MVNTAFVLFLIAMVSPVNFTPYAYGMIINTGKAPVIIVKKSNPRAR